jgi:L-rhamnose mutarotase
MGKYEDADLILKLYDLRREETMRKARTWMAGFNPESVQDIMDVATGEHNAYLRMVMTYWDMAASLVNNGAIDEKMFNDANGEHFFYYAKFEPFMEELRAKFGPQMWMHLEQLIMRSPDAKERLAKVREMSKAMAARRAAAATNQTRSDEQPTQTAPGGGAASN